MKLSGLGLWRQTYYLTQIKYYSVSAIADYIRSSDISGALQLFNLVRIALL